MSTRFVHMCVENFACKAVGYSLMLFSAQNTFGGLYRDQQAIALTALCLAFVGTLAEPIVLPMTGALKALFSGAPGMVSLIYGVPRILHSECMTFLEAVFLAILMSPMEYLFHLWILRRMEEL